MKNFTTEDHKSLLEEKSDFLSCNFALEIGLIESILCAMLVKKGQM